MTKPHEVIEKIKTMIHEDTKKHGGWRIGSGLTDKFFDDLPNKSLAGLPDNEQVEFLEVLYKSLKRQVDGEHIKEMMEELE